MHIKIAALALCLSQNIRVRFVDTQMENLKSREMSMEGFFSKTFSDEFITEAEIEYRLAHAAGRSKFESKWCSRCDKNETPEFCDGCCSDGMIDNKPSLFVQILNDDKKSSMHE